MSLANCGSNHLKMKEGELLYIIYFTLFVVLDLLLLAYLGISGNFLIESGEFDARRDLAEQHVTHHRGCI